MALLVLVRRVIAHCLMTAIRFFFFIMHVLETSANAAQSKATGDASGAKLTSDEVKNEHLFSHSCSFFRFKTRVSNIIIWNNEQHNMCT